MEIVYQSSKLEKICVQYKAAKKFFGGDEQLALSLYARLNAIASADCLHDIIVQPQFRFHNLHNIGNSRLDGYFSINVKTKKNHNRTDGLSGGRFAEMVEEIASCGLGLENLQPHVHRKRSKHQSQKTIDTALARQSNIKGSFCCDSSLRCKNIVVLDDMLTTGATLKEFASTLFEAGAESVSCVVLAVNQFAEEYWYQSHELKEFVDNNKLRINSKKLEPFFSRDGKSFDFISSIENLFGKLNQEIGEERQECFASDDFTF